MPITAEDLEALRQAATEERRRPQDQAAVLLLDALRRRDRQTARIKSDGSR